MALEANETGNLIGSDKVEGTAVYGADQNKIGSIERVMIDKKSGKVSYAVLSFGGFLGMGQKHAPIPWARKGQVLRRLERHEEALAAYEQAIQLDPHYAWAWNGKGLAFAALQRWQHNQPGGTPIFNELTFGGFLIYYTPGYRVFIDDRCELYGNEWLYGRELLLKYDRAMTQDPAQVDRWVRLYKLNFALVRTGSPMDAYLGRQGSGWHLEYQRPQRRHPRRSSHPWPT